MTITITINTENAAFADDRDAEVVRILRDLVDAYGRYGLEAVTGLRDFNGNTVGSAQIDDVEVSA